MAPIPTPVNGREARELSEASFSAMIIGVASGAGTYFLGKSGIGSIEHGTLIAGIGKSIGSVVLGSFSALELVVSAKMTLAETRFDSQQQAE